MMVDDRIPLAAFKSGKIGRNDFIIVYDGSDIGSDKQLAQLTGTISELTVTATTNKVDNSRLHIKLLKQLKITIVE